MEPYFKPITVDMIYVSPLKAKLVEKDGWEKVLPVDKTVPPTGSVIMDAVADILKHTTISSVKGLAAQLKVKPKELSGAIHILTRQNAVDFIIDYRMKQAKELLACTNLDMKEIARRCGLKWAENLAQRFQKEEKMSPRDYRAKHRPEDYVRRYEWE